MVLKAFFRMGTPLLLLAAAGCEPEYDYKGYYMYDHFPLDGSEREWQYNNEDESVDWTLMVEMKDVTTSGDYEIAELEHSSADGGDVYAQVYWSSDSRNGVLIHGYAELEDDPDAEPVWFTTPVVFAEKQAVPGDSWTTETDGYVFTSTFDDVTGCGTYWASAWDEANCLKITITDDDDLESTHGFLAGSYWLVPDWGTAWMELGAYDGRWNLATASWDE